MATNRIYLQSQPLLPAGETARKQDLKSAAKTDLAKFLAAAEQKVNFSQHALQRIASREIELSEQDLTKLDDTVARMAAKGAKESLIYLNDVALVVNVPNKVVITAMDGTSAKETIFTNIDSAAII